MNNTHSFIMRDQVHNLIPSIMDQRKDRSVFRFLGQISVAIVSLATFNLIAS